jgi:hypothetical protein
MKINPELLTLSLKRSAERERRLERPLESLSRSLWPWSESRLLCLVILLGAMDYASTYAFLNYSKSHPFEGGLLAGWALRTGGFLRLFLVDAASIAGIILLAIGVRYLYTRMGFRGFGRAAFVFSLFPYIMVALAVVYNNVLLAFL